MAAARVLLLWLACAAALAAENPGLEKRTAALAHELRCLVCQNQTLADSNAPLAVDLRNQIREQLAAGKSEQDVLDFMVARYGEFVLYRPPLRAATLALWVGPFVFLALGVWLLARRLARRRAAEPELSGAERERAAKLLE
ncbi:MAG TPA: cytochrome c-type biogenesis protein [Burkholderiales bacterium]|jgi:cytochrome c-type biogenesis protein CcmH